MRLLKSNPHNEVSLTENLVKNIPPYAILSHTWGADNDEVTFEDLMNGTGLDKKGYTKIIFCGEQARKDGLEHFWIDTCCINRANQSELSEAIVSMYRWYRDAVKCYVYLPDVVADTQKSEHNSSSGWMSNFQSSRWFTRGWTLQELLAPEIVEFFSREKKYLGSKTELEREIHHTTGIPIRALQGAPLAQFPISERRGWASDRDTTREEDSIYCLLGICDVIIVPIYGEGKEHALRRLEKEIYEQSHVPAIRSGTIPEDALTILSRITGDTSICEMWYTRVTKRFHHYDHHKALQQTLELRHPDTSNWLLNHETYLAWTSSSKSSILWVVGGPGTGKTVLSTMAIAPATSKSSSPRFSREIRLHSQFQPKFNHSGTSVLCTLIHQLLESQPELRQRADASGVSTQSEPQLLTLFKDLVNRLDRKCIILLDGLDFTDLHARISLIGGLVSSSSRIKILVPTRNGEVLRTTQNIVHMEPRIQEYMLHLENDSAHLLKQDRAMFVQSHLDEDDVFDALSQTEKDRIKDRLSLMENFLCCKLALDRLRLGQQQPTLKVPVNFLPLLLNALVVYLIGEISKRCSASCSNLLRLVLYSRTTLRVEELKHVHHQRPDPNHLGKHLDFTDVVKECYPVIALDPISRKVDLVHFSCKELLQKHLANQRADHPLHLGVAEAEQEMAIDCLSTLLEVPISIIPTPGTDSFERYVKRIEPVLQSRPLLGYAIRNWYWHLQRAMGTLTNVDDASEPLLKAISGLREMWQDPSTQALRYVMVKLGEANHLDAYVELRQFTFFCALGLTPFVEAQVRKYADSTHLPQRFESALRLAIAGGHSALAKMLISQGAITTLDAPAYEGLLVDLIQKKKYDMLEVMLKMRHLSMQEIKKAHAATFKTGDAKAYNILRDSRVFERLSGTGATILHAEVQKSINPQERADIALPARIKLLVQREGVDVNARESTLGNKSWARKTARRNKKASQKNKEPMLATMGNAALHIACLFKQSPEVIKALIEVGADVTIPNYFGWTPLHIASMYAAETLVIDYLLYAGGNQIVALLTRGGNSPLHWAVMNSATWNWDARLPTIEKLLRAGANPRLENSSGATPLEVASWTSDGVAALQQVYTGFDGAGSRRMIAPSGWYDEHPNDAVEDSSSDIDYDRRLLEDGYEMRSPASGTEPSISSELYDPVHLSRRERVFSSTASDTTIDGGVRLTD